MAKKAKLSNRVVNFKCELDQLGIEVKDYVDKQLDVMEKFKVYDPEGFEKSFIKHQYEILRRTKEAGYKPEA